MGLVNRLSRPGSALDDAIALGARNWPPYPRSACAATASRPTSSGDCPKTRRRSTRPGGAARSWPRARPGRGPGASPPGPAGAGHRRDPGAAPRTTAPRHRRRFRLRRHLDRCRQHAALLGLHPGRGAGRRGAAPPRPRPRPGGLAGGSAADRSKEALFTRLLAGQPAGEFEKRSMQFAEDHVGVTCAGTPGPGSSGTRPTATGWWSSRPRPRATSGRPASELGADGCWPPGSRWTPGTADRPLRGKELPGHGEVHPADGLDRTTGCWAPDPSPCSGPTATAGATSGCSTPPTTRWTPAGSARAGWPASPDVPGRRGGPPARRPLRGAGPGRPRRRGR